MSDAFERLANDLGVKIRNHGGLSLIALCDCGKIVEACRSNNVLILGIEAFVLCGGSITPEMNFVADYSDLTSKPWDIACYEAADSAEEYFHAALGRADLWFEFVLKERP